MKAAGLNPMLALSQGGASSPGGALPRVESSVNAGLSTAMAVLRLQRELRQIDAQTELTTNQAMGAMTDFTLKQLMARALGEHPVGRPGRTVQRELVQAQLNSARNLVQLQRSGTFGRWAGLGVVELLKALMGPAADAAGSFAKDYRTSRW